jgi:gamma-glutamylcysteine synthetase
MRTATTLYRTAAGWTLAAGPDVPADKQRTNFNNIGDNWPKDVTEVQFQLGDSPAKRRTKERAQSITSSVKQAEARVAAKLANAEKAAAELKAKEAAAAAEAKRQAEAENERIIAQKEAAKAAAVRPTTTTTPKK